MVQREGGIDQRYLLGAIGVLAGPFLVLFFVGESEQGEDEGPRPKRLRPTRSRTATRFPMPAGGRLRGPAQPLAFITGQRVGEEI